MHGACTAQQFGQRPARKQPQRPRPVVQRSLHGALQRLHREVDAADVMLLSQERGGAWQAWRRGAAAPVPTVRLRLRQPVRFPQQPPTKTRRAQSLTTRTPHPDKDAQGRLPSRNLR